MKHLGFYFILILLTFNSCRNKNNDNLTNPTSSKHQKNLSATYEQILANGGLPEGVQTDVFRDLASLFSDQQKDKKEALKWYNRFVEFFRKQNNELALGHINREIGNVLCNSYDFETGIPYLLKSSENYLKAEDYNFLAITYNNLSLAYHDFGDYKKGIEYANLVVKTVQDNVEVVNKNMLWYAYNNLGINYDDNKQYKKAIESHLNALPFALNASDSSYSYNNLGNTHKKLKLYETAEKYFKLSFKYSNDYNDVYHFATLYSNLLDIERLLKNHSKAVKLIDSANYYALKSGSPEKLIDFYYYTYLLKNETGDYKSGSQYLDKYVALKDSLFSAEKAKIVYDYQIKYETEKKEKEIVESKYISKQKSIWLILAAVSIIIGFIVFRNFRIKSKFEHQKLGLENELLKEQIHSKIQEQRLEISMDLHDSLGSQLTFINSIIYSLKRASPKLDEAVKSKLNTLSDFSENSIAELKNTLWVLNSGEIHLQDLKSKILNFINKASEAKDDVKFDLNFEVSNNINLNSKQAINLFRAVQEIINNACKSPAKSGQ